MTRHYGLGHYQKMHIERRYPRAFRLGVALAIGAAVGLVALLSSAHSAPIICNKQGCSARHVARHIDANGNSVSLVGIVAPLKAKAQQIVRDCHSRVVSAYRPGARIPDGHISNHARHRAVDIHGNPRCIYAHLKGWPGGYSIDYARAPGGPHVHISYNPHMEWGARFTHSTRTYHASAK